MKTPTPITVLHWMAVILISVGIAVRDPYLFALGITALLTAVILVVGKNLDETLQSIHDDIHRDA